MKQFKSIKVCENIGDINMDRFQAIKEWWIYKESGMSMPSVVKQYREFRNAFDADSPSTMLISLHDFVRGLSFVEKGIDPHQMMFALMVIEEEDEDQTITDHTFLKERCDRLAKMGVTQGEIVGEVENFITALIES